MRRWSEKILWVLLGMHPLPISAVDLWQVGTTGLTWEKVGTQEGLATDARTLLPAAVNSTQNALTELRKRGGHVESPQSTEDLTTLLTDGNEETFWKVTRERRPDGTSMVIDLGAQENNAVFEQPGPNIIRPLAARCLFNYGRWIISHNKTPSKNTLFDHVQISI